MLVLQSANSQNNFFLSDENKRPADSAKTNEEKNAVRNGKYYCWIYADSIPYKVCKSFIYAATDSGIVFAVAAEGNAFKSEKWQLCFLDFSKIKHLKIKRRGSVGLGIIVGASAGFIVGSFLGMAGIPEYGIIGDMQPGENGLTGGALFCIPGSIIGGVRGSFPRKIPINKSQLQYEKYKKLITLYSNTNFLKKTLIQGEIKNLSDREIKRTFSSRQSNGK